jgi:hypothetical protein
LPFSWARATLGTSVKKSAISFKKFVKDFIELG